MEENPDRKVGRPKGKTVVELGEIISESRRSDSKVLRSLDTSSPLVRYLILRTPCEIDLEFQGSGVATALTQLMENSEPISPC